MAKIIIYGDIDITPLFISVDGAKEKGISGKWGRYIDVMPGKHYVTATTVPKTQRTSSGSRIIDGMTDATNTSLSGEIMLDDDDAFLLQVKQKLAKSEVYHKVMSLAEAGQYVDMNSLYEVGHAPGEKNKWVVFFLCLFFGVFGVHRFYERKIITGIIYLLTLGLGGIGVIVDLYRIFIR